MSILPDFKASYKKLVLPKFGFSSTFMSVSSSISSLYILIKISGSAPSLPAMTRDLFLFPPKGTKDIPKRTSAIIKEIKIVFSFLFCKNLIKAPNKTAKRAEDKAPIKIRAELFLSIPNKIKDPSPPAPTRAARVAVPIIIMLEVLTPDIIIGMARLSLYFFNFSHLVIPKALAASSREGSISANPFLSAKVATKLFINLTLLLKETCNKIIGRIVDKVVWTSNLDNLSLLH